MTTTARGSRSLATSLAVLSALVLSACASADGGSGDGAQAAAVGVGPGQCGSVPKVAPKDPKGVLASLPQVAQDHLNGFPNPVLPSPWVHWKPDHAAPYKVAIVWLPPFNSFQARTLQGLVGGLKASGDVDIVSNVAASSPADVPGQLQQFNQAVASAPDLIVIQPIAAAPVIESIAAATAAGIPVVAGWNSVDAPGAVSVGINNFQQAAATAAQVITKMGGRGTVLKVTGIEGVAQNADAQAGFDAALANCPDVKVAGTVAGNYSLSDTKTATLQFLAANPGKIDGVLQSGTMTMGVVNAFEQLGRPVPVIADLGSSQGSIAYAAAHKDSYSEFGTSGPDPATGGTFARVALRILAGHGPLVNQIITEAATIDTDNVNDVVKPDWTPASADDASTPGDEFISDKELDGYFTTPAQ